MSKLIQNYPLIIAVKGQKMDVSIAGIRPDFSSEELLNKAKGKLTRFYTQDRIKETTVITNSMDVYRGILYKVREMGAQYPSNAWSKYIEIYTLISDIISQDVINMRFTKDNKYTAFCNAELPGSSISALNHLFRTKYPDTTLDWIGSSYKPDSTGTQLGDTYGFFENNKDRWLINAPDFDGDMTNTSTLKDCAKRYHALNPDGCDLYSHDAGLDVTKDIGPWKAYADQERMNLKLHLGCAIVGLETLRIGGTFIAKQYTLYEANTKNLIKIYSEFFDKFFLVKPVTSRPYNSESYFVGLGYRRPDNHAELLQRLYDLHSVDDILLTSKVPSEDQIVIMSDDLVNEPQTRDAAIDKFMDYSAGRQIKFIEEIVRYLEESKKTDTKTYGKLINAWLSKTKIKPLGKDQWLASK